MHVVVYSGLYTQFTRGLCMEDTLQNALKAQSNLPPQRKVVE